MVTVEQIEQECVRLEKELAAISEEILRRFPISNYRDDVRFSKRYGRLLSYGRTRRRKKALEKIRSQHGSRALSLYLKLALCTFISDSLDNLNTDNLPDAILCLYHEWFETVLAEFSTLPDDYYDHKCLALALDVRICSLRDIPVGGAWIVESRRIGLRPFLANGLGQFFDYLAFVIFSCGGFSPYLTTHVAPRYLSRFNEQEMNLTYLRIAELMKFDRRIKGVYRRSWFLDPNLEQISPHLAYLRQVPVQNGAKLFPAGATPQDVKYALAASSTRRRLHEQGKYVPSSYAFIWPRKQFLNWAQSVQVDSTAAQEEQ
ncbi:MAG: hypothetical protein ACYSWO_02700 [Planctomycetota bacterium]|jgi:hypothetical protein